MPTLVMQVGSANRTWGEEQGGEVGNLHSPTHPSLSPPDSPHHALVATPHTHIQEYCNEYMSAHLISLIAKPVLGNDLGEEQPRLGQQHRPTTSGRGRIPHPLGSTRHDHLLNICHNQRPTALRTVSGLG